MPRLLGAAVLAFAVAGLAGCGFRPLYGDVAGAVTAEELAAVDINLIANREGQIVRNRLLTRMQPRGPVLPARYQLDVDLRESRMGLAVQSVSSYASYDTLTAEYATLSAERDARERALRDLADRIATLVALYLQRTG
jgi:LPS-assembly lipoprotein